MIGANALVFDGGTPSKPPIQNGQTYILKRDKAIADIILKVEPMIDDIKHILENVDNVSTSISNKRPKIESLLDGVGAVGSDLTNKEGSVGYLVRSDYLKK